jgi:hypothetical protein
MTVTMQERTDKPKLVHTCDIAEHLAAIAPDPSDPWPLRPRFAAAVEAIVRNGKPGFTKTDLGMAMGIGTGIFDLLRGRYGISPGSKGRTGVCILAAMAGVDPGLFTGDGLADPWSQTVPFLPLPEAAVPLVPTAGPSLQEAPLTLTLSRDLALKVRVLSLVTGQDLTGLLMAALTQRMDALAAKVRAELDAIGDL